MSGGLTFRYTIDGDDFTRAGEASSSVKNKLKMLGLSADVTRRVAIAMYEGEINMVIHADGGADRHRRRKGDDHHDEGPPLVQPPHGSHLQPHPVSHKTKEV